MPPVPNPHPLPSLYRRMLKQGFHGTLTRLHYLKSLILYSTSVSSTGSPLVVEYFVQSLRFSEEEAFAIVNKVSYPFKSPENPELVVDFLKQSGIDETDIRAVVAGFPNVLKYNVNQTLKPKISFLEELGFSGSDLGLILSRHPRVLERNLKTEIGPAVGVLKSLCGSDDEQFVRFMLRIKRNGFCLVGWAKNVPSNIILLQNYGFTVEQILDMLCKAFPSFCAKWDEKILKRVEEKLGIPRTSAMFIYGLSALASKSEEDMESRLLVFRSYGWSEAEIKKLLRGHPLCLSMSEKHLRLKLKYFMEDLGCGSDYLSSRPALLTYSMEKRILPRAEIMQTLKDKHVLDYPFTLASYLTMSEHKFKERLVLPYRDKLPELYQKVVYSPSGRGRTQIRNFTASLPVVLEKNVDKNLRPNIRGFQDFGFFSSDLGLIKSEYPRIFARKVESALSPELCVLKSLIGSYKNVIAFMLQIKIKHALTNHTLKQLPTNIKLLQSYGVTDEQIKVMLSREFLTFLYKWDKKLPQMAEEKLGIPRTSAMFIYGISALIKKSEIKIQSWLQVFRSYGWTETEISTLLKKHPLCLSLSEETLRLKLKYYMEEHGYRSDYLVTVPTVLSFSMEKRILPRAEIIQTLEDKNILKYPCSLYSYLKMSDSKFKEKYVLPYKDELPELYEKLACSPSKT